MNSATKPMQRAQQKEHDIILFTVYFQSAQAALLQIQIDPKIIIAIISYSPRARGCFKLASARLYSQTPMLIGAFELLACILMCCVVYKRLRYTLVCAQLCAMSRPNSKFKLSLPRDFSLVGKLVSHSLGYQASQSVFTVNQ